MFVTKNKPKIITREVFVVQRCAVQKSTESVKSRLINIEKCLRIGSTLSGQSARSCLLSRDPPVYELSPRHQASTLASVCEKEPVLRYDQTVSWLARVLPERTKPHHRLFHFISPLSLCFQHQFQLTHLICPFHICFVHVTFALFISIFYL